MTENILVGFEPPKEVKDNILKLRRYITEVTGQNLYGDQDPHITVYNHTFPNIPDVEEVMKEIAQHYAPFTARITGMQTFPGEPVVLNYGVEKTETLSSMQADFIKYLNALRTEDTLRIFQETQTDVPDEMVDNLKRYGLIYPPEQWKFHASVGCVPQEQLQAVWKEAQKYDLHTEWTMDNITLYRDPGNGDFKLYSHYALEK